MKKIIQTLTLMLISVSAYAGSPAEFCRQNPGHPDCIEQIPEPGTLALFGLGAVVALAFAIKRKK